MSSSVNLFILSELHPNNKHVGWVVSYALERVLLETCDARLIYPVRNERTHPLSRYQSRLFKSWFTVKEPPVLGDGINVLLVLGLGSHFMLSMLALDPLLKQFDLRVGYALDGIEPGSLDYALFDYLDHLFVISAEVADEINATLPISASFLPLAADIWRYGRRSAQWSDRGVDIVNYGRTRPDLHHLLQQHYNQGDNERIYFHTTFTGADVSDPLEHMMLMSKLLSKSKLSVCFEPSQVPRFRGCSPILLRWFEGWSCGCVIVGKRPFGKGVAALLDWEDSTIELPDHPADWIPFFEDLLDNPERLLQISRRNSREALLQHDWRYRICEMFTALSLPIPELIQLETQQLQLKAKRLDSSSRQLFKTQRLETSPAHSGAESAEDMIHS